MLVQDQHTAYYRSPLGWLRISATSEGICGVEFVPVARQSDRSPLITQCMRELDDYFAGTRTVFSVPVVFTHGTPFQQSVWKKLQRISHGGTTTYGAIARSLHKPTASRAVGGAIHNNPVAIIVPCHRVIGSTGRLTGYAGGLNKKQFLLDLEREQTTRQPK